MTLEQFIEGKRSQFTREFEAEGDFTSNPKYTAQPRDINDYTDWLQTYTTALIEKVRQDCHNERLQEQSGMKEAIDTLTKHT